MTTEFDGANRKATLETRGFDVAHANEVFDGATLTFVDGRRDCDEDRSDPRPISGRENGGSRLEVLQRQPSYHQHEEGQ